MKHCKYKAYTYRTPGRPTLAKIIVQHTRGGDYEITFISYTLRAPKGVRARHRVSGYFAIAPTKYEALARLHKSLLTFNPGSRNPEVVAIPWDDLYKKFKE